VRIDRGRVTTEDAENAEQVDWMRREGFSRSGAESAVRIDRGRVTTEDAENA
jgi:hypothetical protein